MGDQTIPYELLKKIMATCAAADYRDISLAVSQTAGHKFDDRLVVTSSTLGGRDPYVLAKGTAIVVGWSEFPSAGAEPIFRVRRARVR